MKPELSTINLEKLKYSKKMAEHEYLITYKTRINQKTPCFAMGIMINNDEWKSGVGFEILGEQWLVESTDKHLVSVCEIAPPTAFNKYFRKLDLENESFEINKVYFIIYKPAFGSLCDKCKTSFRNAMYYGKINTNLTDCYEFGGIGRTSIYVKRKGGIIEAYEFMSGE